MTRSKPRSACSTPAHSHTCRLTIFQIIAAKIKARDHRMLTFPNLSTVMRMAEKRGASRYQSTKERWKISSIFSKAPLFALLCVKPFMTKNTQARPART